ncbi:hypothetical protein BKA66DRAFT_474379 [Pyrenochaeta sp. MPI-SDFR-AT-0127]|nr:hypothetical protein BKA66DRAFT_474379 [Pyrenochaeta sp. MPI-SDFR-AT-0127]
MDPPPNPTSQAGPSGQHAQDTHAHISVDETPKLEANAGPSASSLSAPAGPSLLSLEAWSNAPIIPTVEERDSAAELDVGKASQQSADAVPSKGKGPKLEEEDITPSEKATVDKEFEALVVHFHRLLDSTSPGLDVIELHPNVEELLFDKGPTEYMTTHKEGSADPDWRWIHLPANNMSWVRKLMDYLCEEMSVGRSPRIDPVSVLRAEYWKGRQNDVSGPAGRFLKPSYAKLTPTSDILLDTSVAGLGRRDSFVIFMPYIHWDDYKNCLHRNIALDWMAFTDTQTLDPTGNLQFTAQERKRRELRQVKQRNADRTVIPRTRSAVQEDTLEGVSRHEKLILAYINEPLPLHVRRTLDQFIHYNLPGDKIRARDRDQVLWRHTQHDTNPRILMVDQLWLWVIFDPTNPDSNPTVVTAFPERWSDANEWHNISTDDASAERSDIRFRILQAIKRHERKIESALDLVELIIDKTTSIFHPRANETEPMPNDFLEVYSASISAVDEKQIAFSDRFWRTSIRMQMLHKHWRTLAKVKSDDINEETKRDAGFWERLRLRTSNKKQALVTHIESTADSRTLRYGAFRAKKLEAESHVTSVDVFQEAMQELSPILEQRNVFKVEARIRNEVDILVDNADETDCLREIKDIIDELKSISAIFKTQEGILDSLSNVLPTIKARHMEVDKMIESAEKVNRSLLDLLDLKQKQASVIQAQSASRVVDETSKQGNTILLFTVTTIIYATLSFVAAVFSMNAIEINGTPYHKLSDIFKIMFPTTIGVLLIALLLAYNNALKRFLSAIWRKIKSPRSWSDSKPSPSADDSPTEQPVGDGTRGAEEGRAPQIVQAAPDPSLAPANVAQTSHILREPDVVQEPATIEKSTQVVPVSDAAVSPAPPTQPSADNTSLYRAPTPPKNAKSKDDTIELPEKVLTLGASAPEEASAPEPKVAIENNDSNERATDLSDQQRSIDNINSPASSGG